MNNNMPKRWALLLIFVFTLFALDDYSVFKLNIPPIDKLEVNTGIVLIKLGTSGGKGSHSADHLYLLEGNSKNEYSCTLNSQDNSNCISRLDRRFYQSTKAGSAVSIKPSTSNSIKNGRVWWYEANIYGPLKERRLLQLDVEGVRVISYGQQKVLYEHKKNTHKYVATILLMISIFVFGLLNCKSGKA